MGAIDSGSLVSLQLQRAAGVGLQPISVSRPAFIVVPMTTFGILKNSFIGKVIDTIWGNAASFPHFWRTPF
jgi:hypothetical protein